MQQGYRNQTANQTNNNLNDAYSSSDDGDLEVPSEI